MTCSTSVHTHAHGKRMNGTDCVWVGWRRVLHHSNLLPAVASLASLHAANLLVFLQILNFCPKQLLAISYHDSEIWPKSKTLLSFPVDRAHRRKLSKKLRRLSHRKFYQSWSPLPPSNKIWLPLHRHPSRVSKLTTFLWGWRASIENTVYLLTPLSIVSFILPFFRRCSTAVDVVTALSTIHHQSKLQINIQVVTCENMKCLEALVVSRGLGTKPSGWMYTCIAISV